jgi:DNA-binding CsgD family transcriptional regulator
MHLAAGARLHRRLQTAEQGAAVEAITRPNGRVEHAEGPAQQPASLRALEHATVTMEAARGRLRRAAPELALEGWKGRVAGRWTLVDGFEHDGKRYLLARENEPTVGQPAHLSIRERQIVASAALGRSNKEIAYELGLADSTVRVFIARAAKKLGVNSRDEAVHKFRHLLRHRSY